MHDIYPSEHFKLKKSNLNGPYLALKKLQESLTLKLICYILFLGKQKTG